MDATSATPTLVAWEASLAEAARLYVRRITEPGEDARHELRSTLLRLGFAPAEVETVVASAARLPPRRLDAMREALQQELDTCKRRARAGRIDYDLNRHIAVFRALRQFERYEAGRSSSASLSAKAPTSSATAARVRATIRR